MLDISNSLKEKLDSPTIIPWVVIAFAFTAGTRYYTSAPATITMNLKAGGQISTIPGLVAYEPPQVLSSFDTRRFTIGITDEAILPLLIANPNGVKVTTTLFLLDPDNIIYTVNEADGFGIYGGHTDGFLWPSDENIYGINVVSTPKLHQTRVRDTTDVLQRRIDPRDSIFFRVSDEPESLILTWGR